MYRLVLAVVIVANAVASIACSIPGAAPPTPVQKNQAVKTPVAKTPAIVWADARKDAATIGNLQVRITGARVGKPKVIDIVGSRSTTSKPYLIIYLHLKNLSETKKLDSTGWSSGGAAFGPRAVVTDEFDNRYSTAMGIGLDKSVDDVETLIGSLYPGKEATDVLQFEMPVDKATKLRMELPAPGEGTFRFEIPMSMVKRE